MKLLIIRHAIAMERAEYHADVRRRAKASGVGDPDHSNDDLRPLTEKGMRKMRKNASGLNRLTGRPDLLVSSPLKRAKQTAEILASEWGIGQHAIRAFSRGSGRKVAKLASKKIRTVDLNGSRALEGSSSSKKASLKSSKKAAVRAPLPGEIAYAVELRPEAEPQAITEWLQERVKYLHRGASAQGEADRDVMIAIVGHEPHLSHLIGWLLAGPASDPRTMVDLKKGGACRIDFPEGEIGAGKGRLLWLATPAMLRALV
jgi:phosphohistidine phosphatase